MSQILTADVPSRKFAQSELVSVIADPLEAQLASHRLKVSVVGVGQRGGQVHPPILAQRNFSVFGDDVFAQRRQRYRDLYGRARLRSGRQRQLLIHHRQNAPAVGIDRDNSAIHIAQRFHRRRAHDRVLTRGDVAFHLVVGERTGVEALVIMVPLVDGRVHGSNHMRRTVTGRHGFAAAAHPRHLLLRGRGLGNVMGRLAMSLVGDDGDWR